ncbi:MAG: hypothetical protein HC939_05290 [Pleurocapsa sp. SU_5_0]|jgi:hypothetical protein|uniref:hypothetical protein n=1 Tax=Pleurocapsa sp. CCALA 161 TaxID=2107688 RepID=UPI0016AE0CA3|nr:hypothetical protein [Pleurocapsa sp. CCALA 161]NJK55429.1 hypothetical protein [Pleurocapsa sp. SU_5_0]NJO97263.1 hypothetical protein [Pleurocapsa sp. CRU_1_2]NJR45056.1 hypothetical protein [Hyellaceae cyanobacterium CSU_1_1]
MNRKIQLITLLIWQYINQQLGHQYSVWNIRHFWYLYQITLFKRCWEQECSQESHPHC